MRMQHCVRGFVARAVAVPVTVARRCHPVDTGGERPFEPGVRRERGRRHEPAVHRRAGRHHPRPAAGRVHADGIPRHSDRRSLQAASRGCSDSRSIRTMRRTGGSSSITRASATARWSSPNTGSRHDPDVAGTGARRAADDPASDQRATTTAACWRSGPTAISTSASATAAPATIRRTTRRTSTCCSARSCASTSTMPDPVAGTRLFAARRQSVRRMRRAATRSSRSACAIPGASASIA